MNTQANGLKYAVEAKRQELIENLNNANIHGFSDGRTLERLTLQELQTLMRQVKQHAT